MANATVIDRLFVELGLDPALFKKGSAEVRQESKKTETDVTKSAGQMLGALHKVAAEFISLFLVVRSVHDVIGLFTDLNEATRQLGINSTNTGESAAHLRDWGNIAEMAGGKAEDAMGSITGLQQSIFNAKQGFGWNDQLTNFGRIGVDTGVAQGRMRDFHSILADTAKALQQFSQPDRFQWTQKLGLQGGIANAVVQGPEVLEKYWQQQLKIHQTTDADTRAAQELAKAWDLLKDKMRALTTQILTAVSPALQKLFGAFSGWLTKHQGDFEKGVNNLADWASGDGPQHIIDALVAVGDAAMNLANFVNSLLGKGTAGPTGTMAKVFGDKPFFRGGITDAEKKAGLPMGTLDREDLTSPSRNKVPIQDTADEIAAWHQSLGGDKGDPNFDKSIKAFLNQHGMQPLPPSLWQRQKEWFQNGMGGLINPIEGAENAAQGAAPTPRAQQALASKPTADTGFRGGGTKVTIERMNVYTQATDANGVATDMNRALNNKLTVTQADGGLS